MNSMVVKYHVVSLAISVIAAVIVAVILLGGV
jgi:hypothetical protein